MSWPVFKIGEICKIVSGSTPSRTKPELWNGDISWITPKDLDESRILELHSSPETITDKGLASCSTQILPVNSVLFSSRAPIGLVAVNKIPLCTNQGFKSLIPGDKTHYKYLAYWLKANRQQLQAMGNGATFKELSKSVFEKVEIPLPPLEVQKKIAAVLEKADTLRRKREEQIKRLDDLLQATFLDMFGDPVTNPKGWPVKVLENIVSNDCPVSYGIVQPGDFVEDGIPVVRPVDLDNGVIQVSALKKIAPGIAGKYPRSFLKGNELLLTVRGSIGAVYLTSNEFAGSNVTRGIVPLRFNERIANKEFVYCMFQTESFKGYFKKISKGATLVQLNINELRKVPIILPAMEYQKAFKDIFLSLTSNKSRLEEASKKMDNTFNSLMQRAFKGELELK